MYVVFSIRPEPQQTTSDLQQGYNNDCTPDSNGVTFIRQTYLRLLVVSCSTVFKFGIIGLVPLREVATLNANAIFSSVLLVPKMSRSSFDQVMCEKSPYWMGILHHLRHTHGTIVRKKTGDGREIAMFAGRMRRVEL